MSKECKIKRLEEVVKTRDDPSKLDDLVIHDVQVEKATQRFVPKFCLISRPRE